MKLEILGVGSGFSPELGNSSFLIWNNDETSAVLMDCGSLIFGKLREMEMKQHRNIISKIDTIFISHTHMDHCGSLGTLMQYHKWVCQKHAKLAGVSVRSLLDATLMENTNAYPINVNKEIEIISTRHGKGAAVAAFYNGILYSGDSAKSLLNTPQAQKAHTIIHEVSTVSNDAHIGVEDLAEAPSEIRAKTWLTHYTSSAYEPLKIKAAAYGFAGLLKQGQILQR